MRDKFSLKAIHSVSCTLKKLYYVLCTLHSKKITYETHIFHI